MSNIRDQIEAWFAEAAKKIHDHRLKTLALSAIFVALFISQFPKIQVDASTEGFLFDDDPAMVTYNEFRERFGMDGMVIIALKPGKVFEPVFLKKLRALHRDLRANLPHLEEITSLVNARSVRGEKDDLIVEDFLENWPADAQEMAALEKRAKANAMYENMLISEDGAFATIVIQSRSYSPEGGGLRGSAAGDVSGGGVSANDMSGRDFSNGDYGLITGRNLKMFTYLDSVGNFLPEYIKLSMIHALWANLNFDTGPYAFTMQPGVNLQGRRPNQGVCYHKGLQI